MRIVKLVLIGMIVINSGLSCNAMDNSQSGFRLGRLIRHLIKPLTLIALAFSGQAAEAANSTNLTCPAHAIVPVRQATPLQMATVYFDGKNCAPRCIAQADWLGPLEAFCADMVGCEDMYLQGALDCEVDPERVAEYNCSITHTSRMSQQHQLKRPRHKYAKRRRRG